MRTRARSSKRFWIVTVAGVVAFAVLWATAIAPARGEAASEREESKKLATRVERHFAPEGEPLEFVETVLVEERETLAGLRAELETMGIKLPPEYQPGPDRDPLYFQKKLSEFRGWVRSVASTGVVFAQAAAPMGFREGISEDVVAENLARLAVARRFVGVAERAAVKLVLRVQQRTVPSFYAQHARAEGVRELPFTVTVSTDEKGLVRLVQEMSRPETFLSVKGLVVQVRDTGSGAFEATVDLAGVRVLERPDAAAAAEEEGAAEAGLEPAAEPGVLVPTVPAAGRPRRDF